MDRVCVVGYGVVGKATAELFGIEKHFDVQTEKSNMTVEEVAKCEIAFICIPTPVDDEGNYKVVDIENFIAQCEQYGSGCTYVIRSTVYPGFANQLMRNLSIDTIISNPEFLTEATAERDSKNAPFVLIGGVDGFRRDAVTGLYAGRLKHAKMFITDNKTAELTKLAMNGYFSTKVIFANQMFDAAESIGADYETLKHVLESHPFGPKNHFEIFFNGKRGVHGKCLPKDTEALARYTGSELVKKVLEINKQYN